mmetsp:Transcript_29304/g.64015  ORF Transcript_29304/g.64015 Transcript_29304/m.64015 type:complete len:206 (+) Transcript_29304:416-1033(+)
MDSPLCSKLGLVHRVSEVVVFYQTRVICSHDERIDGESEGIDQGVVLRYRNLERFDSQRRCHADSRVVDSAEERLRARFFVFEDAVEEPRGAASTDDRSAPPSRALILAVLHNPRSGEEERYRGDEVGTPFAVAVVASPRSQTRVEDRREHVSVGVVQHLQHLFERLVLPGFKHQLLTWANMATAFEENIQPILHFLHNLAHIVL